MAQRPRKMVRESQEKLGTCGGCELRHTGTASNNTKHSVQVAHDVTRRFGQQCPQSASISAYMRKYLVCKVSLDVDDSWDSLSSSEVVQTGGSYMDFTESPP